MFWERFGTAPFFVATFLLLLAAPLANGLVDLSQPWILAANGNQNELYCTVQASMGDLIVGYVVLQDGVIVAEGYTEGNTASDLNPANSATKSWSSMILGLLVDEGQLQENTTLGELFTDDAIWVDIVDADEKKTLTVHEILTFSAGLSETLEFSAALTEQNTLAGVLNATSFNAEQRGTYEYLPTNHILARIIHQVSGKTPLEVATTESGAFDAMGLKPQVDYTWDTFGGVEGSAFGLRTNPRALAKLGLLYIQEGRAAPDAIPIVSPAWISSSTTNQLAPGIVPDNNPLYSGYGYQWYTNDDGSYAAVGGGGQMAVVFPNENIVVAVMTRFDQNTLQQATLQSVQLVQAITESFDEIANEGSCVVPEVPTIAPTEVNEPTSSPTSSPTSGSSSAGAANVIRLSVAMVAVLLY